MGKKKQASRDGEKAAPRENVEIDSNLSPLRDAPPSGENAPADGLYLCEPPRGSRIPLYDAVIWIASKGGSIALDTTPLDQPVRYTPTNGPSHWKFYGWVCVQPLSALDSAMVELLDAIHRGKLSVEARRGRSPSSPREPVPAGEFGSLADIPFGCAPFELIFGTERYLDEGYLESGERSAEIRNRWDVFWNGLVMADEAILRLWPEMAASNGAHAELAGAVTARRGRPPSIPWEMVYDEIIRLMDFNGPFSDDDPSWNTQACLEKEISQFISNKFGENAPAKSEVVWGKASGDGQKRPISNFRPIAANCGRHCCAFPPT